LTTLSGRQYAGKVSGEVLFNGKPVSLSKYHKLFGFVPQEDVMLRMMTVYETLYFAARKKLNLQEFLIKTDIEEICKNFFIQKKKKHPTFSI
jgi:ABC-type multidrug transport system ATPase subunit